MKFKFIFVTSLIFVLNACYIKNKYIPAPNYPCDTSTSQVKLQKVKEGEWKKDDSLNVLCATGGAICADEAEALCYSDHDKQSAIPVNNFEQIRKHSVSVCWKDGKVLDSVPVCQEGNKPVCGYKRNVSKFISSSVKPVCGTRVKEGEGGSTETVICPFGGKPVCVKEGWNLQAYCVNDKNLILSDKWLSDEHYYDSGGHGISIDSIYPYKVSDKPQYSHISCSGEDSVPKCYSSETE